MQNECRKQRLETKNQVICALPKTTVAQVLGKQMLRSGTSVGANYREANRARSKVEFISKMGDCLKELDETAYWLELLVESGIVRQTILIFHKVMDTPYLVGRFRRNRRGALGERALPKLSVSIT